MLNGQIVPGLMKELIKCDDNYVSLSLIRNTDNYFSSIIKTQRQTTAWFFVRLTFIYCHSGMMIHEFDMFQGYVYHACEMCKKAIAMVNKLHVFSDNEDIEEVSSVEMK